jgi:hypothetical protein
MNNLYWHFLPNDKKLGYGDGRRVQRGKVYRAKGELSMCENGMHGCKKPLDCLNYAQGSIICRVELVPPIIVDADKSVARGRKVLWWIDGEKLLHEFACRVAVYAMKKAKVTDERSWNAIKVKRLWLKNKATDQELAAAWAAARDAAWAAARDAARDAAWAAARDAARDAAWAAARAVAWAVARDVAWAVAREKNE